MGRIFLSGEALRCGNPEGFSSQINTVLMEKGSLRRRFDIFQTKSNRKNESTRGTWERFLLLLIRSFSYFPGILKSCTACQGEVLPGRRTVPTGTVRFSVLLGPESRLNRFCLEIQRVLCYSKLIIENALGRVLAEVTVCT